MLARSGSMGVFVFTPHGADDAPLREAGFGDIRIDDVTANVIAVSGRWHAARERAAADLDAAEGAQANAAFEEFLAAVHRLASQGRLSRCAYTARKTQ